MKILMLTTTLIVLLAACTAVSPPDSPATESSATVPSGEDGQSWLNKPLPDIASAIADGDITSVDLVNAYLQRISLIDRSGPNIRSVLSLNPLALERAEQLDALHKSGGSAGPLHGVPILLKDNIEARGPLATTAGSTALINNVTDRDSPLVAGLRDAGAIILGKANLSEWANYRSSFSSSGWSALGGQVRNPHILDRNPCGSSSGSGAAIAAALAAGAVGTETNGSIICPSTINGIVGFKPTVGLVSTQHIIPVSTTQDTAGPMTRTVLGTALMLDAMTGSPTEAPFSKNLEKASLVGVRLGVARYSLSGHRGISKQFENALRILADHGAVLVDINDAPKRPENFRQSARLVMATEFKHAVSVYLASTPEQVKTRTLSDLIAYNAANAGIEMPLFGQDIFKTANATSGLENSAYLQALATIRAATREGGIDFLLANHQLDALVFPSGPLASLRDPINGDVWPTWVGDGATAAIAGYPHITVPMGTVHAAPIGLSFVASGGSDASVLRLGYAFEQAAQLRVEPGFLQTIDEQAAPFDRANTNKPP